jgi:hypothetical protein
MTIEKSKKTKKEKRKKLNSIKTLDWKQKQKISFLFSHFGQRVQDAPEGFWEFWITVTWCRNGARGLSQFYR